MTKSYSYDIKIKTPIHLITKDYYSMLHFLSLSSKDIDYLGVQVLPETLKYHLTQQDNLNYIDLLDPYFIIKNIQIDVAVYYKLNNSNAISQSKLVLQFTDDISLSISDIPFLKDLPALKPEYFSPDNKTKLLRGTDNLNLERIVNPKLNKFLSERYATKLFSTDFSGKTFATTKSSNPKQVGYSLLNDGEKANIVFVVGNNVDVARLLKAMIVKNNYALEFENKAEQLRKQEQAQLKPFTHVPKEALLHAPKNPKVLKRDGKVHLRYLDKELKRNKNAINRILKLKAHFEREGQLTKLKQFGFVEKNYKGLPVFVYNSNTHPIPLVIYFGFTYAFILNERGYFVELYNLNTGDSIEDATRNVTESGFAKIPEIVEFLDLRKRYKPIKK